jgi:hypothetical protein
MRCVLSGFDRLRLMATLRPLYQPSLMMRHLSRVGVLLKDFGTFAASWTERVRSATHQLAKQSGRPLIYLQGSSERKELLARELARRDGLTTGLIGIWSVLITKLLDELNLRRTQLVIAFILVLHPHSIGASG